MADMSWVKELVRFEREMEESGMIDFSAGFDPDTEIRLQSVEFMRKLKEDFVDYASSFNEMRGGNLGRIKIYGISNTPCDFMLFRNGYKLIFSLVAAGKIAIRSRHQTDMTPGAMVGQTPESDDYIVAQWGAFGELKWTFQNQALNPEFLVRFHLSRFVRESAK